MWQMAAFLSKGPICGIPEVFPWQTLCHRISLIDSATMIKQSFCITNSFVLVLQVCYNKGPLFGNVYVGIVNAFWRCSFCRVIINVNSTFGTLRWFCWRKKKSTEWVFILTIELCLQIALWYGCYSPACTLFVVSCGCDFCFYILLL